MANISLTLRCNRRCAYCFAEHRGIRDAGVDMPVEQFSAALELCARSGIGEARLLGGEPTLHPRFTNLVDLALARGFRVLCFSGGIIPKPVLAYLEQLSSERIQLVLNCPPPGRHAPVVYRRQREVMERLGPRISLGINYDVPGISAEFLLDAIERYGLVRRLRLGLAHPVHGGTNDYLLPCHFPEVGARVAQLAASAAATGIGLNFDCGWVPCMFPDTFLAGHENIAQQVGNRCNPILDILPDGSAISCYSLRRHATLAVSPGTTASDLRNTFSRLQAADRKTGVYRTCETCRWWAAGQCGGGCLATALLRSRRGAFAFRHNKIADAQG